MNELKFPFKFVVDGIDDVYLVESSASGWPLVTNTRTKSRFDCYTEGGLLFRINSGVLKVVKEQESEVTIKQPEVFVRISQTEYDSLIDEINMLRELVAEITLQTDYNSLEQQARVFQALNDKMIKHQSFKEGGDTRMDELLKQLDVLFAAYDSLSCSSPTTHKDEFKPVSEMTLDDWKQAKEEGWKFETESQGIVFVIAAYSDALSLSSPRLSYLWYVDQNGYDEDDEGWTIVKRVK